MIYYSTPESEVWIKPLIVIISIVYSLNSQEIADSIIIIQWELPEERPAPEILNF